MIIFVTCCAHVDIVMLEVGCYRLRQLHTVRLLDWVLLCFLYRVRPRGTAHTRTTGFSKIRRTHSALHASSDETDIRCFEQRKVKASRVYYRRILPRQVSASNAESSQTSFQCARDQLFDKRFGHFKQGDHGNKESSMGSYVGGWDSSWASFRCR